MADENLNTKSESYPGDDLPWLITTTLIITALSVAFFLLTYFAHPNIENPLLYFWPVVSNILGLATVIYASVQKSYGYSCSHLFNPNSTFLVYMSIAVNVIFSVSCFIYFFA